MTGPKHLWSGNWREESRDPPAAPAPPAEPSPPDPVPVRRLSPPTWRALLPAVAVILVVAIALAELLPSGSGRSGRGAATTPAISAIPGTQTPGPAVPTPSTTPGTTSPTTITGHTITWLGMQISTVENVGAVIQTVRLGSPADAAGLDPGDIIQSVNHHPIATADQIRGAVRDLKLGNAVLISVGRGSTLFATAADFSGQPVSSP